MSWWEYGYQIADMADCPTLVDNNTRNNSKWFNVVSEYVESEALSQLTSRRWARQCPVPKRSRIPTFENTISITCPSSLV
jgi:hypothetical protein